MLIILVTTTYYIHGTMVDNFQPHSEDVAADGLRGSQRLREVVGRTVSSPLGSLSKSKEAARVSIPHFPIQVGYWSVTYPSSRTHLD